jgi:digeranylgeranylglycerophospholipid reductase
MGIECDVLVVGGGPAGCSAARAAAKKGAKTILVEEHKEIGMPVKCAEGMGKYLLPFLPFKIPREQLKWEIKGMTFWAKNMIIERNGGIWSGYTINRKNWDQWLASLAKKEGSNIRLNSKLVDLQYKDNHRVYSAIIESNDKRYEIHPKTIIAADGVDSTVVNLLGVKNDSGDMTVKVKSFEMKNLQLSYPHHDQVFVGDFSPNGYAYIFPISHKEANIGIGLYKCSEDINEMYNEFLELPVVKKQLKNGVNVIEKSGNALLKYQTDSWVYGNVILVGDAANQNMKPFIEGNLPGIICGDIAGKFASDVIKNRQDINDYQTLINKILGPIFKNSDELLEIMLEIFENKNKDLLNLIIGSNIYSLKSIKDLFNESEEDIQRKINSWKNSEFKQFTTRFIEIYYLCYLYLWRKTRSL